MVGFWTTISLSLKLKKDSPHKGFVKISTNWRRAGICVRERSFCWAHHEWSAEPVQSLLSLNAWICNDQNNSEIIWKDCRSNGGDM